MGVLSTAFRRLPIGWEVIGRAWLYLGDAGYIRCYTNVDP